MRLSLTLGPAPLSPAWRLTLETTNKAVRIDLFRANTPQMRAFHLSWLAFFFCFFAWFGISPLMPVVRKEFQLTPDQVGWCIIASTASTIFARLFFGWLCDRIGPRLSYTWLLVVGSLGVMGIGLAHDYTTFLMFRLLIGGIGASFVITQYHTSVMFAPNCVGTANATTAGWGNLGGGATHLLMPALFALLVGPLALSEKIGWRLAMGIAGGLCFLMGIAYYRFTQDTPEGNFSQLRAQGKLRDVKKVNGAFWTAFRDYRVWALFVAYGACFGIEVTINNTAALYFTDSFKLSLFWAGLAASLLGMMNLFARALGGIVGDRFGARWGLRGRVRLALLCALCGRAGPHYVLANARADCRHTGVPGLRHSGRHVVGGDLLGRAVREQEGPGRGLRHRRRGRKCGCLCRRIPLQDGARILADRPADSGGGGHRELAAGADGSLRPAGGNEVPMPRPRAAERRLWNRR